MDLLNDLKDAMTEAETVVNDEIQGARRTRAGKRLGKVVAKFSRAYAKDPDSITLPDDFLASFSQDLQLMSLITMLTLLTKAISAEEGA